MALFGEVDAGKTTLLCLLLMGFDKGSANKAKLFGLDTNSLDRNMRRKLHFVIDNILWE